MVARVSQFSGPLERSMLAKAEGARPRANASPDANTVLRHQIQLIAGCDLIGFVPIVDIAHSVAAIFSRRVGVGSDLLAQRGFTLDLPPSLGEGQEKALFAAQ